MIEAMACGTPVVAYPCGSVPEVVDEGKTGFIVSSEEEALKALERIEGLNSMACRRVFEERFSADRMAREYTAVYSCLCERESTTRMTLDGGTVWTKSSESRKNFTSSLPQL
jgi:glycosyltransferase involved in cell wall biosynthesis